jgi:hypothetical protein
MKNNNLPAIPRIFMSKKMTECRLAFPKLEVHRNLNAEVV